MPGSSPSPAAATAADWYEPVTADLEQGDILIDFPVLALTYDDQQKVSIARSIQIAMVLTQSCDIAKTSQKSLTVVQVLPYADIVAQPGMNHLKSTKGKEALGQGTAVAEVLLPPCPGVFDGPLVIALRHTFVLPKQYVFDNVHATSQRLRSPYKEYVAQAYARFVMRVGLPINLTDVL